MSAPERIWATPFDYQSEGGTYCDAENRPLAPNKDAWCYVRIDAPELLAMVEALRAVEGWWLSDGMKNSFGAPVCIFETRSAITAWEKLTK